VLLFQAYWLQYVWHLGLSVYPDHLGEIIDMLKLDAVSLVSNLLWNYSLIGPLFLFTCLAVLFHNLCPGPLWSTSWSEASASYSIHFWGWRNVWSMKWRAPDVEEDQRGPGQRLWNKGDAIDRCWWTKLIKVGWWSGWVWVGECFFWYQTKGR